MNHRPDTSVDSLPTARLPASDPPRGGPDPAPTAIAGYSILREAGRGGMGVVYEAVQLNPLRPVALKMLYPEQRKCAAAVARFRTEVTVAARLHHTNIVPVLAAVGGPDGPTAYAMPLIRGESLAAVLRAVRAAGGEPASAVTARVSALAATDRAGYTRAVAEWVRQAAEAVAAAHAAGAVHRDVKPGNLLLEFDRTGRPHVWLHDFGLAVQDGDPATADDAIRVGTPGYRSPEQVAGDPAAIRPPTDVYSLGVTLAELLTLTSPKEGMPVAVGRAVPRELRRVIAVATAAAPADRYASAVGLADDLARFLAGYPVRAGRPRWFRGAGLWVGRHRRALTAAAAATAAAVVVATVLLARAYAAERAARRAADVARRAVATNTLAVDDILYATPGQLDAERAMLEQAVRVQELQLELDPGDVFATRHLAHASWRLGRVYARLGRPADGASAARRAADAYRAVAAADPMNPLHRLDVARSLSVTAMALRSSPTPDLPAADAADAEAYETARALLADFPTDMRVRDAAATYTSQYGAALAAAGRFAEAEALYRRAAAEADRCRLERPDLWRLASPAVHARMRLAQLLAGRGRLAEALAANEDALALSAGEVARAAPEAGDADKLELLSFRSTRLELLAGRAAWLIAAGGDATGVVAEWDELTNLVAGENPEFATGPGEVAHFRAWAAFRAGRPDAAAGAGRAYLAQLEAQPAGAIRSRLLSRYHADGPGGRDLVRAEAAAREAVRLAPGDAAAAVALAAVHYHAGRLPEAEAELARCGGRFPTRTGFLIRAAVAARTGRPADARRLLDEAHAAAAACEPCTPEWEAEARRAVAAAGGG
jgi:tetratricopeptide (TPR) repeat protein/tRNA A-37 threonylcarbamoyl transferase component Bud32